jgi:hypothetical protein
MPKVRLFKSSLLYPKYRQRFYRERPALAQEPFARQIAAFLADGFGGFGGAWQHYLEATGQYEVMETILDAEPAQRQWAREHGVRLSEKGWQSEVLGAQMAEFKPDIWFCHSALPPEQRLALRRACPSIRFVFGYDGAQVHAPARFAGCDAMVSCARATAKFYRDVGMNGYWMSWGFDPRVAQQLSARPPQWDSTFCGSIFLYRGMHLGRILLLDHLCKHFDIALFVPCMSNRQIGRQLLSFLRHGECETFGKVLRLYPALSRVRAASLGERYGLEMFQLLADSRVTLNLHGDYVKTAANIRLFEATGVGTCLLTDWKDDLRAVFEPEREVVTFRSHEECAEKLRYLLDHENERQSIAAAGQKRCLRDHHIGNRILAFADEVLAKL